MSNSRNYYEIFRFIHILDSITVSTHKVLVLSTICLHYHFTKRGGLGLSLTTVTLYLSACIKPWIHKCVQVSNSYLFCDFPFEFCICPECCIFFIWYFGEKKMIIFSMLADFRFHIILLISSCIIISCQPSQKKTHS